MKHVLPVPHGDRCMHEFVASAAQLKAERDISAMDIAKRLLDYGFHAPTVYFPLIVPEAMMIEPTETESKATLDAFAETLECIIARDARAIARRPAQHARQPAGRGPGGAAADADLETTGMIDAGRCRLLRHAPGNGAWNMAVDEMLLERAEEYATACLRFYGWSEPTLSLGYFQIYADRQEHPPSLPCAVVRRLTGGGAIVHDAELTYSIVLPGTHPLATHRDELYQVVHGCLIETLGHFGITARLCGTADNLGTAREPFLCFQRRSPGDVLIGRTKVCGSAQRRRNGAVLQHGSLLWRTSPAAPGTVRGGGCCCYPIELESVADLWLCGLSGRLGLAWQLRGTG